MDKPARIKNKKASDVDAILFKNNNEVSESSSVEVKKKHKKSNSNLEEFAFGEKAKLDEQLQNFVSNYDGKKNNYFDIIYIFPYIKRPY